MASPRRLHFGCADASPVARANAHGDSLVVRGSAERARDGSARIREALSPPLERLEGPQALEVESVSAAGDSLRFVFERFSAHGALRWVREQSSVVRFLEDVEPHFVRECGRRSVCKSHSLREAHGRVSVRERR